MRVKIIGNIISKTKLEKTNYSHGIYSMVLNTLNPETTKRIHNQSSGEYRLFTYSNIYIKDDKFHFYLSGEDSFVYEFIAGIEKNNMLRLEDMVIVVNKMYPCPTLPKKDRYLFKGRIIASEVVDRKKIFLRDNKKINEKLRTVSLNKLKVMGIEGDINFDIIKKLRKLSKYKDSIHIESWDSLILVSGDYEAVKTIYEIGLGENTSTGHGLLWEV